MKGYLKNILFSTICLSAAVLYFRAVENSLTDPHMASIAGGKSKVSSEAIFIDRDSPPCLQMYYSIEKYAAEYDIPLNYAYGVAYCETRYRGPFHWNYNHAQTSPAGAVGPMQIMPRYAGAYIDQKGWTTRDLRTNIDMNVKVSMRMLRKLHRIHHDWKLVFGAYNTGRPIVNDYAINVYNYKPKFKLNGNF